MRSAARVVVLAFLLAGAGLAAVGSAPVHALNLPPGFYDETVFEHLQDPTAIRFAPDGRIFVAGKQGVIYVFDNLEDEEPTIFADLRKQVYDNGDRGILGLELDPNFEVNHRVYVLYTFNHVLGEGEPGAYPRWSYLGEPERVAGDPCPKPENADVDACPVSGRLVRLTAEGDHAKEVEGEEVVAEDVLVEDWCQQFSSHSIGDLQFGPEGALFASGGEGSNFNDTDYGQFGWPEKNQCGDPPGGETLTPPTAEGGSLRSQNTENLDGSVIRVNPETGEGLPGNPFYEKEEGVTERARENEARIVAFGFRNPFRFAIDPGSDEVYVGNVGWYSYEEIDRFPTVPSPAYNSGWPCYEGPGPTPGFDGLGLDVCEALYNEPDSTEPPFFSYEHDAGVTPEDTCVTEYGSAISGLDFYEGEGVFPPSYTGAFFFSDPVRRCIYVMFPGEDGEPDPSTTIPFLTDGGIYPGIDIQEGPEGDLYYVKLFNEEYGRGEVHRIAYSSDNQPPVARLTATPQSGPLSEGKLKVEFDASGSTDPNEEEEPEPLKFEWDLNYDGVFGDAPAGETATETFEDSVNHLVAVRVVDAKGAKSVARITVYPGDSPPEPEIIEPAESISEPGKADFEWHVGQPIHFEGAAQDPDQVGALPPTSLEWNSRIHHCPFGPETCHVHPLQAFLEVDSGILNAPDHDYPSLIELTLTATDERGLAVTKTIDLYPHPVELTIQSDPPGVTLGAGQRSEPAPYVLTAIEDSKITLSAPKAVELEGNAYPWESWSDGGARVHTVTASSSAAYTAFYAIPETPQVQPPEEPRVVRPQTKLHKHPPKRTHSSTARFTFASNERGASFLCKLDGGKYRSCRSPRIYRRLKPGKHVFQVKAVDSGRADQTPAAFRWRVR